MISTLQIAELLDSEYQMDYVAILNEARELRQKLLGLKDQIDNLLENEDRQMLYQSIDFEVDVIDFDCAEGQHEDAQKTLSLLVKGVISNDK